MAVSMPVIYAGREHYSGENGDAGDLVMESEMISMGGQEIEFSCHSVSFMGHLKCLFIFSIS